VPRVGTERFSGSDGPVLFPRLERRTAALTANAPDARPRQAHKDQKRQLRSTNGRLPPAPGRGYRARHAGIAELALSDRGPLALAVGGQRAQHAVAVSKRVPSAQAPFARFLGQHDAARSSE